MAMRRYAIYLLLLLLSLAVFGCAVRPQPPASFAVPLQRLSNFSDDSRDRLSQPVGLPGPLLAIAPEAVRFLRPEPAHLTRNGNGSIQIRNGEILSVSGLIPEFPHCTVDFDELSGPTLSASRSGPSGLYWPSEREPKRHRFVRLPSQAWMAPAPATYKFVQSAFADRGKSIQVNLTVNQLDVSESNERLNSLSFGLFCSTRARHFWGHHLSLVSTFYRTPRVHHFRHRICSHIKH